MSRHVALAPSTVGAAKNDWTLLYVWCNCCCQQVATELIDADWLQIITFAVNGYQFSLTHRTEAELYYRLLQEATCDVI